MDKMFYAVSIMQPDGPDDVQWIEVYQSWNYPDTVRCATEYYDKGHRVKIYDPFMDRSLDFDEIGAQYGLRKTETPKI